MAPFFCLKSVTESYTEYHNRGVYPRLSVVAMPHAIYLGHRHQTGGMIF